MPAILFGSISTVADTSELQREAFNEAFRRHDLDWSWSREDYLPLLERSGGEQRITEYAQSVGQDVDAEAIHATKSQIFQEELSESRATARPGVSETIAAAKGDGFKVALVTTTAPENTTALLSALGELGSEFDLVVDSSSVESPKPDRAAYTFALEQLGEQASACVAIEDNVGGVESARSAGLRCVAFPNQNTAGHEFADVDQRVERLEPSELRAMAAAG